jgi:glyoxylase-like metal-dependent hydrolase (beta-lactamase superfamily II)
MILKQYYLGCLAHASYLLGDDASSTAIVVDPRRDTQQYLADAEKLGLQIRHVFLTHFHADLSPAIWNCATVAAQPSISAPAPRWNTPS